MSRYTQDRFNEVAGEAYDDFMLAIPHHNELQKYTVLEFIRNYTDGPIIELGTGTGITLKSFIENSSNLKCGQIYAIDKNQEMLRRAQGSIAKSGIDFRVIDILDFLKMQKDGTVGGIFSVWVLHNLPQKEREIIYQEINRVLIPGGIFVNGDKYAEDNISNHARSLARQLELFAQHYAKEDCEFWVRHYCEDDLIKFTETEQISLLPGGKFIYRKIMDACFVWKKPI